MRERLVIEAHLVGMVDGLGCEQLFDVVIRPGRPAQKRGGTLLCGCGVFIDPADERVEDDIAILLVIVMDEVIEEIIIRILVERIQQVVILPVVEPPVPGITDSVLIAPVAELHIVGIHDDDHSPGPVDAEQFFRIRGHLILGDHHDLQVIGNLASGIRKSHVQRRLEVVGHPADDRRRQFDLFVRGRDRVCEALAFLDINSVVVMVGVFLTRRKCDCRCGNQRRCK